MIYAQNFIEAGMNWPDLLATLVYSLIGILIMIVTVVLVDKIFKLHIRRELIEDNNVALGILIAGVSIAVAVIIAATIIS